MSDNVTKALELLRAEISAKRTELRVLEKAVADLERQLAPIEKTQTQSPTIKTPPPKAQIPWSENIDLVFEKYDRLKLNDVCERLMELGLVEEIDSSKRASISGTLSRKVTQGKLTKLPGGIYAKPLHGFIGPTIKNDEGAEPGIGSNSL